MVKANRFVNFGLVFSLTMAMFVSSCSSSDEPSRQTFPLSADIFKSVDDTQVAFQGLTHSAVGWFWDFGDGTTSSVQNPVHVYESGGFYTATLTATDSSGNSVVEEVKLALAITPYVLLTGGPTAENGKTWKLSSSHSSNGDYFGWADGNLTPVDDLPAPLPDGAFKFVLNMPEVYNDEFTFHFDGSYKIDVKTGAAFSGIVYQFFTTGGAGIVNPGGAEFGLVTGAYTPEDDATFTYVAEENFTNLSIFGAVTYSGVTTFDFSGTGYAGFLDFQRKVIVQEITDTTMRIAVFASLDPDAAAAGASTHALILSFEVVN